MGEDHGYERVMIEAIDFDWIFSFQNTRIMIEVLSEHASPELLVQKSLRVFIQLMWEQYQPAIVYNVFIPYMIYMIILVHLATVTG